MTLTPLADSRWASYPPMVHDDDDGDGQDGQDGQTRHQHRHQQSRDEDKAYRERQHHAGSNPDQEHRVHDDDDDDDDVDDDAYRGHGVEDAVQVHQGHRANDDAHPEEKDGGREQEHVDAGSDSDSDSDHDHDRTNNDSASEASDMYDENDSQLPPLPTSSDSFDLDLDLDLDLDRDHEPASFANDPHSDRVDEREMRRRLMDVESSFVPDLQPPARLPHDRPGADDTYLNMDTLDAPRLQLRETDIPEEAEPSSTDLVHPSSPAAAAAERWTMRSQPSKRPDRDDGHDDGHDEDADTDADADADDDDPDPDSGHDDASPSPDRSFLHTSAAGAPPSPAPQDIPLPASERNPLLDMGRLHSASARLQRRPSYFSQRNASHLSAASAADTDYSSGDYALQTGGAVPDDLPSGHGRPLSRLPSLGSVVSAMSRDSESNAPAMTRANSTLSAIRAERALDSLQEEDKASAASDPTTPRPPDAFDLAGPTDTIIARHVQNIRVPDTVADEYRQRNRSVSPDKRPASSSNALAFNNRSSNLTLKEQNSKIDKLTKENFDLKLKIHFLDQALQDRSDEGVKDMINKNVQFQTDLANERKDNQTLRRKIRDLERRVKQLEQDLADARRSAQASTQAGPSEELEYEILQLSEELDRKQAHITRLSAENVAKEAEKRKMKDYVAAMNEQRTAGYDAVDDESDMWKDLLTTETARREQAEDDVRRLRDEVAALRSERCAGPSAGAFAPARFDQPRSTSVGSDAHETRSGAATASSSTLVEQLQHENAELRRDLGAQTSMLTSRNRERERLQQEIEDLKLVHRKGDDGRSLAGDSILDRSVSRQFQNHRSASRASAQTGLTHLSDAEREEWEQREGLLRDQNAALRLDYQELQRHFTEQTQLVAELEEAVHISENELDGAVGDLRLVQSQRNEAYQALEQAEAELEQVKGDQEKLRIEAVTAIEDLEDNLDKTEQARQRTASDLKDRNDDFLALQRELRDLNGSIMQLEDDRAVALKRIEMLDQELEDANRELDAMDKKLQETGQKNQRLEVQSESLHSEISFLREEQEGDKIKIGDLENSLNAAQDMIQDEKEKMQELEDSLVEERRQREIVDDRSKQDVQKIINDLNSENSKSKDEVRRLRRSFSQKEAEAKTSRTRLEELEDSLRKVLGDQSGKHTSWLHEIERMQSDLESTAHDLNQARSDLAEKDRLLRNRDILLESSGLESRRLSDLLDKERTARRKDLHQFEQSQRGNSTNARRMAQHESRALDLENARSQERRKMAVLEQRYRDQLLERNTLLFALWNRLSALCGAEWAERHGDINGETPSVDVISRSIPDFHRNIIDAVKTIESVLGGFKLDVRNIEKSLRKDYQTLEQNLDARVKRMDFLERAVKEAQTEIDAQAQEQAHLRSSQNINRTSTRSNEEISKLKQEVKLLKAELKMHDRSAVSSEKRNTLSPRPTASSLLRHHSSSAVETLGAAPPSVSQHQQRQPSIVIATPPIQPSEQRWIHRLKELERRLKAEREGRLLDRKGARQRLEERDGQIEDMRNALEREKDRRASLDSGDDGRVSRGERPEGAGRGSEGSLD